MIRTLVVEDDPLTARAHAVYVERVPGFALSGVAGTGQDALRLVSLGGVDLVLLDMNLPDMHGMDVCRAFRSQGRAVDVIAVTSARELAVVRSAVSQGVVQYLLKPFVFAALRDRLERYAEYRTQVAGDRPADGQHEIDRLMGGLSRATAPALPKGLSQPTLETVITALRSAPTRPTNSLPATIQSASSPPASGSPASSPPASSPPASSFPASSLTASSPSASSPPASGSPASGSQASGLSAGEVAERSGLSRVAARRYLEYLHDTGLADRRSRYGGSGRPEIEYTWRQP